ncbi:MAG: WXG100 family type VII secretion target [Chloroflexi bacterium]|nr:WXG100 family type VII secretion target [Chloroflexota bacterium]
MATLHFDTDAGRQTSNLIATTCSNLQSEMNTLGQRVNGMVGSEWQGNSAIEFQGEYQSWSQQLQNIIEQLQTLRQRLDTEIAEWEATASKF